VVFVGGALDGGVRAEGAFVRLLSGMTHLVATQRVVIARAVRAKVAAEKTDGLRGPMLTFFDDLGKFSTKKRIYFWEISFMIIFA
jgi:hypothetical protein